MQRRAIAVRGIVQGVGFRPFVHGLASRLQLSGFVTNSTRGVLIEVEGECPAIERFERELSAGSPPLAQLQSVSSRIIPPRGGAGFRIESSITGGDADVFVSPDVATCDDCLAELFDPANRRYRYPFINCTGCGPRLTIVTGFPYDRERTTMAGFEMCGACRGEYEEPSDRRFHAEPIACAVCGPRVTAADGGGRDVAGEPIAVAARALRDGRIVAIKGLGGFHLACNAAGNDAVKELRSRKHRDEKPFALMVADLAAVRTLCEVSAAEAAALTSAQRPIVILRRAAGAGEAVAAAIAPGTSRLGLMLPYTPLHHLLLEAVGGQPLVMTSGNAADEPIAATNEDALDRLHSIADLFLLHDRPIHVRCDDSVVHVTGTAAVPIRRSRGYAPEPLSLPFECPAPILAVGGQLKSTFALGRGHEAFLSHHIGDLDELLAVQAFSRDVELYQRLFSIFPAVIAHDLHPDYASTALAASRPEAARIGVQHHHAHVASCMAEHGLTGDVIGVAWDGAGFATDGTVWGGEFFVGGYSSVKRAAHLRSVAMPGGDRAAREPWRMACAHQHDAGIDPVVAAGVSAVESAAIRRMIERRVNAPLTSSAGRLFDAVACLCGLRERTTFEGQAAIALEQLAESSADRGVYPCDILDGDPLVVDTRPLIRAIVADRRSNSAATISRRFHTTLADVVMSVCVRLRDLTGLTRVVFSGGVFLNRILAEQSRLRLAALDFEVYQHRRVPPGDGGLSLGQLAVAAARVTDRF